jgi:hypothetical protein
MRHGNTRQNEREIPTLPFLTFFSRNSFPISNGRSLCLGFLYVIPYRHFSSLENMLEYWLLRMNEADNSEQSKDSRCKAKKKSWQQECYSSFCIQLSAQLQILAHRFTCKKNSDQERNSDVILIMTRRGSTSKAIYLGINYNEMLPIRMKWEVRTSLILIF